MRSDVCPVVSSRERAEEEEGMGREGEGRERAAFCQTPEPIHLPSGSFAAKPAHSAIGVHRDAPLYRVICPPCGHSRRGRLQPGGFDEAVTT